MKADFLIHLVILKILSLITLGIILIRCTKYHYDKSPDDDLLDDDDLDQGHHQQPLYRKGENIDKFNFLPSLHNCLRISCYCVRMNSATVYME